MYKLQTQKISKTDGTNTMPKPERVKRVVARKVRKRDEDKAIEEAVKPKRSRHIPQALRVEVIRQAKGICQFCYKPFTAEDPPEVDHVIPFCKDGLTQIENLQALHASCNNHLRAKAKAGKPPVEPRTRTANAEAAKLADGDRFIAKLAEAVGKKKRGT